MNASKGKGVLAKGAESPGDDVTLEFWWRNPERLMTRVMALAESDPRLLRLLRAKVGKLAAADDEFRIELKKDIEAIPGKREGRRGHPEFFKEMVVDHVDWLRSGAHVRNLDQAYEATATHFECLFPGLTDGVVRGIYQRARAVREKHKNT
jgi:hypothetical protein